MSDADSLRELCEVNFSYKPWFDESKCVRIGKASPQLLRITLASESAASELIHVAKINLRKAECASNLSRIYFNPDLTPAEQEQAYLRRKNRRENGTNGISTTGLNNVAHALDPMAPPFPCSYLSHLSLPLKNI